MGKLTTDLFCAKEGRRRVVGVEVELGADGGSADSIRPA
jgi:hypothetical protein